MKKTSKTMREIGEFGLIERIRKSTPQNAAVELGIGDDAAVFHAGKNKLIFTTDMIIENRHFRLSEASAFQIGWKALAVNISDIAAMGGRPTYAVVAVGVPPKFKVSFMDEVQRGLRAIARRFNVSIVGGDTNASDKLIISVGLLGEANLGKIATRSGAKEGDRIFVTGRLGGSYASRKHLMFVPRVSESQYLMRRFNVSSMMDVSDGLASDIHRIAERSGVGACLSADAIPCTPGVHFGQALSEGEDFELLFTLSPREAKKLKRFYEIGVVMPKPYGIRLFSKDGRAIKMSPRGFDHFK